MSMPMVPGAPADTTLDPQVTQDAADAAGVILTSPKARSVVAVVMAVYAAALSVVTAVLAALVLNGYAQLIPTWVGPALVAAAAAYVPVSSITHGIWKANIK